jgi:hypothetical protein
MGTTPALWEHALKTYETMHRQAKQEVVEGEKATVYEGFLSRLIRDDLGIAIPYYGKILRVLSKMGCIAQIKRGGGNSPSRWILFKGPSREEFDAVYRTEKVRESPTETRLDVLEQRVKDIQQGAPRVDVEKALFDLQEQLDRLKAAQSG